jgi:hypothetical protein
LRLVLGLFLFGLVLSGVTAFPLKMELHQFAAIRGLDASPIDHLGSFDRWILTVRDGIDEVYEKYPWFGYGTDWLALAHIVIAVFFIGPFIDPVRNVWILKAGIVGCMLVIPLALICGPIRQVPVGWRLIDCSFGIFGALPLWYCLRLTKALEKESA